jgi:hypothetical protein
MVKPWEGDPRRNEGVMNLAKLADVLELTIFTDDPILPATQEHVITPPRKILA